jgi:hypothetical protein
MGGAKNLANWEENPEAVTNSAKSQERLSFHAVPAVVCLFYPF